MKKIIAISVMFALVIGAAFADTSVGGGYHMNFGLALDKNQVNGSDVGMGKFDAGGDVNISAEGDNAGGKLRIWGEGKTGGITDHALVWWKPIDQLRIQLGKWDSTWEDGSIVGWGFTGGAKDVVALGYGGDILNVDNHPGFWGGFGNFGLGLSVYPADGIEINIGIPLDKKVDFTTGDYVWDYDTPPANSTDTLKTKAEVIQMTAPLGIVLSNTKINVKAAIPDIGTAKFTLDLKKNGKDAGVPTSKDSDLLTDIYLSFYLSALESSGMGAEVGLAVTTSGNTTKKNDQIVLGLGFKYEAGDLGLKAGLGVGFGEGRKVGSKSVMPLYLTVLPYYNLGSLTAFVNVGFATKLNADPAHTDIFFNPYVQVPISGGNFWAGIQFSQEGAKVAGEKQDATWSIPIGFNYSF